MMMVMLMSILQIVVVVVLGCPGSRVARLQFLVQIVRQLSDHLRRVVLLLSGAFFQAMMKSVHAVRLGQLRLVIVVMVMVVMMLQLMMRRDAQQNRVVVIPRRWPVL